jgi:hypothetical protein
VAEEEERGGCGDGRYGVEELSSERARSAVQFLSSTLPQAAQLVR